MDFTLYKINYYYYIIYLPGITSRQKRPVKPGLQLQTGVLSVLMVHIPLLQEPNLSITSHALANTTVNLKVIVFSLFLSLSFLI